MFPTGQPLERVVGKADLNRLLEDPAEYLSEGPLVIGPAPVGWFAPIFAVGAAVLIVSSFLWLGIAVAVLAGLFFVWWLFVRRHRLILRPDGAEVVHGTSSVWVPWSVFRVAPRLVVREAVPGRWGLVVPINPDAVPLIEFRQ